MKRMKLGQVEKGRAYQILPDIGPNADVWVSLGPSKQEGYVTGEVLCQHKRSSQGPKDFWGDQKVVRLAPTDVMKHIRKRKKHAGFILSEQRMAELRPKDQKNEQLAKCDGCGKDFATSKLKALRRKNYCGACLLDELASCGVEAGIVHGAATEEQAEEMLANYHRQREAVKSANS